MHKSVALQNRCGTFASLLLQGCIALASSPAWTIVRTAALVCCAAILSASLLGGLWIAPDSINIFAPYWLGAGLLILSGIAITERRARRRAAGVAVLLACYVAATLFLLAPAWATAADRDDNPGEPLTLISFNLYKDNANSPQAAEWLLRQNADIVVLVEAAPRQESGLRRLRLRYPYAYGCSRRARCSTVILSRRPAEDHWPLAQGDADNRRALSAVTARFLVGGRSVPITAVHLERPWPFGVQTQSLAELGNALRSVGQGGIVAGDFNSAPWTFAVRGLADPAGVRSVTGMTGTWPASADAAMLRLPLDQIYVGPCMTAESVRRGPYLGSDHFPIVARIRVGCGG